MLRVGRMATYYGQVKALKGINLNVREGEIVAVLGSNGAGKSTLLGSLAGIYTPREGSINFLGEDITGLNPEQIVRKGISLVPERREIFDSLNVYDNLKLGAYHWFKNKQQVELRINYVLKIFPLLQGREKELAGSLSGGLQQMLAIGRSLMAKPRLLMLDEPSTGLAPLIVKEIMKMLKMLRNEGTTIVLVEQNSSMALKTADRIYILERGNIAKEALSSELMKKTDIKQAYLGG